MYTIFKSKLDLPEDQIAVLVSSHIEEQTQWEENMRLYEEEQLIPPPVEPQHADFETDEAYTEAYRTWGAAVSLRRQKYPPPEVHPEIEAACHAEDGSLSPNYRIVDDIPPSEKLKEMSELKRLQQVYSSRVYEAQAEALGRLSTPGKVLLMNMRVEDIQNADRERLSRAMKASDWNKDTDVDEFLSQGRSAEDNQFMGGMRDLAAKQRNIQKGAAILLVQIEDLTEDNVHSWTMGALD